MFKGGLKLNAVIIQANEVLETNIALVYKSVFLGETASVLLQLGFNVQICDTTIENYSMDELMRMIMRGSDLIVLVVDVQQSRVAKRIAEFCKLCSPKSKILVIGRATSFIPQYFERYPFDAVHIAGDREAAVSNYAKILMGEISIEDASNLSFIIEGKAIRSNRVEWLQPESWFTPEISGLPLEKYVILNEKQHPNRDLILGITATKGCPHACPYCGASIEEGTIVRYGIAERIVDWANSVSATFTVQLWSPDILSSKAWLESYIQNYELSGSSFKWRGVARISSFEESKIKVICDHNCKEIAVGVEMIKQKSHHALKSDEAQLITAIDLCKQYGINLKCLLMLGYPGYSLEDVKYTIKFLKQHGLNYRITGYTPLQQLSRRTMTELDSTPVELFDRRTYYIPQEIDSEMFYKILFSNGEVLL